jgi:hypothetical protein
MSDIYHEIQEDLRRDRLKAIWARYGTAIVIVAALVVVGAASWRGYEYYGARKAAEAGDRYEAASRLAEEGKADEARAAFAAIAANGPEGYAALARFREANELAKTDKPGALKLYQAIADGASDPMLRDAARTRAAYIGVDAAGLDEVKRLAEPLVGSNEWGSLAREAIGLAAYKANDAVEARKQFEAIVADADAPGATRQRADLMLSVLPPAAAVEAPVKPTN